MGLDMFGWKVKGDYGDVAEWQEGADNSALDRMSEESEEIAYWRKHPNLHGWMERLYRTRGGKGEFNMVRVRLHADDLNALETVVLSNQLPSTSGFFFGQSHPEDRENDIRFIAAAREAIAEGYSVYYSSWW